MSKLATCSIIFGTLVVLWKSVVVSSSTTDDTASSTVYTAQNGYMPITTNTLTYDPWPYLGISVYGLQAFYDDMYSSILALALSSSSSSMGGYTYAQLQANPFLYCVTYDNIQQGIDQCTSLAVQKGKERISTFYYNSGTPNDNDVPTTDSSSTTISSTYTQQQYYDLANIFGYHTWTDNFSHFVYNLGVYQLPHQQSSSSSTLNYYYFDILSEIQQNNTLHSVPPWVTSKLPFAQNYVSSIQEYMGIYHISKQRIDDLPTELFDTWCYPPVVRILSNSSKEDVYRNASTITCYITNSTINTLLEQYPQKYPTLASLNPYIQRITQSTYSGTNLTLVTTACIRTWLLASLNRTFNSPSFTTPILTTEPSSSSSSRRTATKQQEDNSVSRYTTSLPITSSQHPELHRLRLKFAFSHLLMDAGKYLPAIQLTTHSLQSLSSIIMMIHRNIDALNNTVPFGSLFAIEQLFFNVQMHLGYLFERYDYPKEARESFRKSIDGLTKSLKKYTITYDNNNNNNESSVWQVYGDTLLSMRTSLALSLNFQKETVPESVTMGESIVNDTIVLHGLTHPLTAFVLNNYGYFLNQNYSYDKAETILRQSYDIYATLDLLHASVPDYTPSYNASMLPIVSNLESLRSLSNLATALEHRYKYNESEYLYRIVYYNRELLYGPYHADTIKALLNLAAGLKRYGYQHKEKMNEASELFRLAYERKTFIYGTFDNVDIDSSSMNGGKVSSKDYQNVDNYNTLAMYADTLMENGNTAEALTVAQKAHQGLIRIVGENHTNVLMLKETMAACYHALDRQDEALNLFEYILDRREEVYGKNDSHSIRLRRTVGAIYVQNRNNTEAIRYIKELIKILEETYGPYHTDTLKDSEDFTNQLFAWNLIDEAESYQKKVHKGYQKIYGPKHEKTLRAQSNLGSMTVLLAMNERNKEIRMLQETGKDYILFQNPDEQNLDTGGIPFMEPAPLPGEEEKNGKNNKNTEYQSEILFRRAEMYLKQAYLGRNATIGINNKDTIHTVTELATLYLGDENYRSMVRNTEVFKSVMGMKEKHYEAIQLYRIAMNAILQISSTSDPESLRIMYNYANAVYTYSDSTLDDKLEAIKTYRTVAEYRRLTTGKEHPDTLLAFTRLATAIMDVSEEIYQNKLTKDQKSNAQQEEYGRSIEEEEEEEDKEELRIENTPYPAVPSPVVFATKDGEGNNDPMGVVQSSSQELSGTPPTPPKPTPKATVIKVSPSTKQAYHQSILAAEEAEGLAREAWEIQKIRVRNMRMSEDMDNGIDIKEQKRKKKREIQVEDGDTFDRSPRRTIKEVEPLKTLYIIAKCILKQKKEDQYREAEKYSRMVAKSRKELLGPKHPDTNAANKLLYDILTIQGKVPTDDKQYIEAAMAYM